MRALLTRAGNKKAKHSKLWGDGSIKLRPHSWEPQTGRGWKVVLEKCSVVRCCANSVSIASAALRWSRWRVGWGVGWGGGGGAVGGRSALRKDPQVGQPGNPPHWLKSLMQSTEGCSVPHRLCNCSCFDNVKTSLRAKYYEPSSLWQLLLLWYLIIFMSLTISTYQNR